MLNTGRVLVVTDDPDAADFLTASLALDGYDTERCDGPGAARDCPRLHGVGCTLRERADVAVVDLDCDEDALVCSKVPEDGGTVFVRRSSVPPIGRRGLTLAVEGARRHVESLRGAPLEQRTVRALDLD
jgi:CheY-like chemotaxis protein